MWNVEGFFFIKNFFWHSGCLKSYFQKCRSKFGQLLKRTILQECFQPQLLKNVFENGTLLQFLSEILVKDCKIIEKDPKFPGRLGKTQFQRKNLLFYSLFLRSQLISGTQAAVKFQFFYSLFLKFWLKIKKMQKKSVKLQVNWGQHIILQGKKMLFYKFLLDFFTLYFRNFS